MVGRNQPTEDSTSEAAPPPPRCSGDCGCFINYNISGDIFELTSKYKHPVEKIGQGSYGVVCSALDSETNQTVAIKKIKEAFDDRNDASRTLREIKILRHFDHENIISIRDVIPPPQKEDFVDVYVVFDRMDTDLAQIIKYDRYLRQTRHKEFLHQILRGLKYIHSANVVHLDLKPSNILVNVEKSPLIKICDFGLARATSSQPDDTPGSVVTMWYRPPELLLDSRDYNPAIDMWSVGCIFMELMTGKTLFPGRNKIEQLRLILQMIDIPTQSELGDRAKQFMRQFNISFRPGLFRDKFHHMDRLAIDLAEKMLTFDHKGRITAADALSHPYFTEMPNTAGDPTCSTFSDHEESTKDQMRELVFHETLAFNDRMKKHYN